MTKQLKARLEEIKKYLRFYNGRTPDAMEVHRLAPELEGLELRAFVKKYVKPSTLNLGGK